MCICATSLLLIPTIISQTVAEVLTQSFVIRLKEMEQLIQDQKQMIQDQRQVIQDQERIIRSFEPGKFLLYLF